MLFSPRLTASNSKIHINPDPLDMEKIYRAYFAYHHNLMPVISQENRNMRNILTVQSNSRILLTFDPNVVATCE